MNQLAAIVFDAVDTLFDLAPVDDALDELGYPDTIEIFFTRLLRDGTELSLANTPRPFGVVADGVLQVVAPRLDAEQRRAVISVFGRLPIHDDVEAALELTKSAGLRCAVLTNGSTSAINSLVRANGLEDYVDTVFSVEDATSWKPGPSPYRYALERLDLEPRAVAMVAAHAWDCHGAKAAGLRTGWVSRLEGVYASTFTAPDVRGSTLDAVVAGLINWSPT